MQVLLLYCSIKEKGIQSVVIEKKEEEKKKNG